MKLKTYREFWPFYLSQHRNPTCRGLHLFGTALAITLVTSAFITQEWTLALIAPVSGYLFAWVGHFFFEKNRPATFTYPFWSFRADFQMLGQTISQWVRQKLPRY